ncbi:MAG TPA: GvpL/GvpF family gas vesicle protein [Thermoanaerobaculia bacterium]|nr:GvpL/GvpF family gas vesicle protein [Thermoanaerobaculia bacterium]
MQGFWVYAIARAAHPRPQHVEAIDGSAHIDAIEEPPLVAFATPVELTDYAQQAIDARAGDLEWLGAIGYRHAGVMQALARGGSIVPLRAFTLFGSAALLQDDLRAHGDRYTKILDRVDGKQEWTLRVEFDPQRWSEALIHRVEPLRDLQQQIDTAAAGRAYLLRKKLDDERKRASKSAEEQVVAEIERAVLDKLACETVAETRERREGAFPQINVLINRDEESLLHELRADLLQRYEAEGITLALTGPWPPYTFASAAP